MSDPIVITRELVKRGWSDFEPKLITGLLSGSVAAFVVSMAPQFGIHLSALQENFVAVACFFLGGYLTPSTGTAVTKRIDAGLREVEIHPGPTVTTVTGPLPVHTPKIPTAVAVTKVESPGAFTQVLDGTDPISTSNSDAKPTEVLPPLNAPYARGQSLAEAIRVTQENSARNGGDR